MTTVSPDTIVIARNQVSKEVQDLLVIRLRKHEIEIERAKAIARAVVAALKACVTVEEVGQIIPKLQGEYQELQHIFDAKQDVCRHDIEHKVTTFVEKLIHEGKFHEAASLAEDTFTKLAARPINCELVDSEIEHEFAELEGILPVSRAPAQAAGAADGNLVPILKPAIIEEVQDAQHESNEKPNSPTNQTMPSPLAEEQGRMYTVQTETIPGSDEAIMPFIAPPIPRDAAMPDPTQAAPDFSDRAAQALNSPQPAKFAKTAEGLLEKAKSLGAQIAKSGQALAQKVEDSVDKKLQEHKDAQATAEKKKESF